MTLTVLRAQNLSAVPGIRHGFSTRAGGVSTGPFASLDLGLGRGTSQAGSEDQARARSENRRRFLQCVGAGPLNEVDQVHGPDIVWVGPDGPDLLRADGIGVDRPNRWVGVRSADCLPVLLVVAEAGRSPEAVMAVHAGWRGAVGGILGRAVRSLRDRGTDLRHIRAAMGPAISVEAFEVGDEVVEAARKALDGDPPPARPGPRGRPHLDLRAVARTLLERAGVEGDRIECLARCTYGEPQSFFSYRRDGAPTGSQLSVVGWTSSTSL